MTDQTNTHDGEGVLTDGGAFQAAMLDVIAASQGGEDAKLDATDFELLRLGDYPGAKACRLFHAHIEAQSATINEANTILKWVLTAIETGRSEPLFVARDTIRNYFEDAALAIGEG